MNLISQGRGSLGLRARSAWNWRTQDPSESGSDLSSLTSNNLSAQRLAWMAMVSNAASVVVSESPRTNARGGCWSLLAIQVGADVAGKEAGDCSPMLVEGLGASGASRNSPPAAAADMSRRRVVAHSVRQNINPEPSSSVGAFHSKSQTSFTSIPAGKSGMDCGSTSFPTALAGGTGSFAFHCMWNFCPAAVDCLTSLLKDDINFGVILDLAGKRACRATYLRIFDSLVSKW
mmetsp:Transcript_60306/g.168471  ORF Transcript_60306/g.168471 Transcript_60306/m.168471 type:complete len:232 (+) Transcript_60306:1443-2138(+)